MWDQLFTVVDALKRHESGPFADIIVCYTAKLREEGYSKSKILDYVYRWEGFARWVCKEQIKLHEIDEDVVERYLDAHLSDSINYKEGTWRTRQCRPLRYLLECWRADGYIPPPAPLITEPVTWYDDGLALYRDYLVAHCGLRPSTVQYCLYELKIFMSSLSASSWEEGLTKITVDNMDAHLLSRGQKVGGKTRGHITSVLRRFFRYLFLTGQLSRDLSLFVPSFQTWRLSELPQTIPWESVLQALESIDRETAKGKRDFAMLILVVTYGLRAGEVLSLQLEDIDWRHSRLIIRTSKTRRRRDYPLLPAVRDALISYIHDVRPQSTYRNLFFRTNAPIAPLRSNSLYAITKKCLLTTGMPLQHYGPHALRHALAIHLLESGNPLKNIGDFLGHRRIESTYIYTKAPYDLLREAALDITEVLP